jgi:tetratricopeptide (TPR) repeat protein
MEKDLSYLLRYDVYHSLSQIDIPHPLRSEFVTPAPDELLSSSLGKVEKLLAEGHFLLAAYLCGTILTSRPLSPTDTKLIFGLFYTRLACLELSGNAILAAQESKALEDLTSAFYYLDFNQDASAKETPQKPSVHARHIVPWPLRVLAVRLQSIGFGDSRRGIGGLYELGLEARREIMRTDLTQSEREIWKDRLADLGIRSVNALIEMGDLDAARRSLDSLKISDSDAAINKSRKVLLFLIIGDIDAAKKVYEEAGMPNESILKPLLSMAEGQYNDAVAEWRALLENGEENNDKALISQNLAVCLLYTGQLNEVSRCNSGPIFLAADIKADAYSQARQILESLVAANHSFGSLVFNLSTVYELCSDKASILKTSLAESVAKQPISGDLNLDRPSADFKL